MLILTRRAGEKINIKVDNKDIDIYVLQSRGKQVRLGFEAPRDIVILREEVMLRELQKQKK